MQRGLRQHQPPEQHTDKSEENKIPQDFNDG